MPLDPNDVLTRARALLASPDNNPEVNPGIAECAPIIAGLLALVEATRLEWVSIAGGKRFILVLKVGELPNNLLSVTPESSGLWFYSDGYPSSKPDRADRGSIKERVEDFHRSRKLPCPLPPFPVKHSTLTPPGGAS